MKARNIKRILILASVFAAFVVYLCACLVNITPFFFFVTFCAATIALFGFLNRAFAAVKLYTQKTE